MMENDNNKHKNTAKETTCHVKLHIDNIKIDNK